MIDDVLIIRKARFKDAAGIARVHVATWQSAYKGLLPDLFLKSLSVEEKIVKWEDILSKPEVHGESLVAEIDRRIVGFCMVGKCRDEDMKGDVGELWGIYVDKDFAGEGIGTDLHDQGMSILKDEGFNRATLWVLVSNEVARKWYESKGWRVEGKTKKDRRGDVELSEMRYVMGL